MLHRTLNKNCSAAAFISILRVLCKLRDTLAKAAFELQIISSENRP